MCLIPAPAVVVVNVMLDEVLVIFEYPEALSELIILPITMSLLVIGPEKCMTIFIFVELTSVIGH